MPAVSLLPSDLAPFATIDSTKAQAMIDDALALATRIAPCIVEDDFTYPEAAKAILRGAVLRWNESGTGAMQTENIGNYGYTVDTRQQRRGMFWPSEIEQLQQLCQSDETSGAFAVDTVGCGVTHADICALNFGATYCSCGALLTGGWPLYEVDCP